MLLAISRRSGRPRSPEAKSPEVPEEPEPAGPGLVGRPELVHEDGSSSVLVHVHDPDGHRVVDEAGLELGVELLEISAGRLKKTRTRPTESSAQAASSRPSPFRSPTPRPWDSSGRSARTLVIRLAFQPSRSR